VSRQSSTIATDVRPTGAFAGDHTAGTRTRHFRIWRGDRSAGALEDFQVEVNEGEVVLDVIHRLQATQTPDLAVRWNCKAGKCGSCSMEINGLPKLACMTRMSTFEETETVTVTPLRTFPVIRDLVTDVSFNYVKARELPAFAPPDLAPGEYRMQQLDVERSQEFRKCIECFLCQNVCHVIRDHEENKPAFSGPRLFIRAAELDMHPLETRTDRKELAQKEQGLGYCNITKCCTEVCPEHIKITDNGIIPMKERVVDLRFDPLVRLGRRIFRRDQLDDPAAYRATAEPETRPSATHSREPARTLVGATDAAAAGTGGGAITAEAGNVAADADTAAAAGHKADTAVEWHHRAAPAPQGPPVKSDGRLTVSEFALDRAAAASPFGDDLKFPLPPDELSYQHPSPPEGH
jgi:succinate dehydrogenase / fumarate reductase, iron-sulfur subunit